MIAMALLDRSQAHFVSRRYSVRFMIVFHTQASWESDTAHLEHMRRQFDTVIKTDTIFNADPSQVTLVKESLRREDMWKERWAAITIPDRALTVGTLRYGTLSATEAQLQRDADAWLDRTLQQVPEPRAPCVRAVAGSV